MDYDNIELTDGYADIKAVPFTQDILIAVIEQLNNLPDKLTLYPEIKIKRPKI